MRAEERWPNKPMVPTAITSLIEYVPGSLRQHIGEPLGRQRATHDGPRFTAEAQRAQRREQFQRRQRATSGSARIGPTRDVQRTTQWRVASDGDDPRAPQAPNDGTASDAGSATTEPRSDARRRDERFHNPPRGDARRRDA